MADYDLQRSLTAAVMRAEERFARDYQSIDSELTAVLIAQTRFADVPSVHLAIKEMLTHPFQDPVQTVSTLKRSFSDVLPAPVDRARVDAAVNTFLHYLGEEVLYIPQLQHLYSLAFQKVSTESSRDIAMHTAALVESMRDLHIMQVEVEQRRGLVERALAGKRTLLIVDNLETVDDEEVLTFLRELPDPTKAIVTTRHALILPMPFVLRACPTQMRKH